MVDKSAQRAARRADRKGRDDTARRPKGKGSKRREDGRGGNQRSVPPTANLRPLDEGLFSFHEYDGPCFHEARQDFRDARIWATTPEIDVVEDAVFVPAASNSGPLGTRQRVKQSLPAGIVDRDGQPVPTSHLRSGASGLSSGRDGSTAAAPVVEVDEEVVYLGRLFDNYGHFLLESLARTWALQAVDRSVRVVFHRQNPARWMPTNWMQSIMPAFGIPPERILLPTVPTRFRRIIIPEPLFEMRHMVHEQAAAPYHAVATRVADGITPSAQPVYLSRRLLSSSRRPIVGEAELEDVLRENGFLVAHPETMTFEDQVRLVNTHAHIFSSTCSAAHNAVFALHRPHLHLMASEAATYRSYFLCSALVGAPTAFVNCLNTGDRSLGGNQRWMPEIVAMGNLVDYLDRIGLLKTRTRATVAGRAPALRREYEEAWLYASVVADLRGVAPLSEAVEREAVSFARTSWPVSLALARYYVRRDAAHLDPMVRQFAELVGTEFDINRLARYRMDVEDCLATLAKHCEPATASLLAKVGLDCFLTDLRASRDEFRGAPVAAPAQKKRTGTDRQHPPARRGSLSGAPEDGLAGPRSID